MRFEKHNQTQIIQSLYILCTSQQLAYIHRKKFKEHTFLAAKWSKILKVAFLSFVLELRIAFFHFAEFDTCFLLITHSHTVIFFTCRFSSTCRIHQYRISSFFFNRTPPFMVNFFAPFGRLREWSKCITDLEKIVVVGERYGEVGGWKFSSKGSYGGSTIFCILDSVFYLFIFEFLIFLLA